MAYHPPNQERYFFSNKYGSLDLVPVGPPRSVKGVRFKDIPIECQVADQDIEPVVLITENNHTCPTFPFPLVSPPQWAVILYVSSSMVHDVRVENLKYVGPKDAVEEIDRVNSAECLTMAYMGDLV